MNSQELWIKINMINIKGVNIKTCTREKKAIVQLQNFRNRASLYFKVPIIYKDESVDYKLVIN